MIGRTNADKARIISELLNTEEGRRRISSSMLGVEYNPLAYLKPADEETFRKLLTAYIAETFKWKDADRILGLDPANVQSVCIPGVGTFSTSDPIFRAALKRLIDPDNRNAIEFVKMLDQIPMAVAAAKEGGRGGRGFVERLKARTAWVRMSYMYKRGILPIKRTCGLLGLDPAEFRDSLREDLSSPEEGPLTEVVRNVLKRLEEELAQL